MGDILLDVILFALLCVVIIQNLQLSDRLKSLEHRLP
jgi:hypothetical protein